MKYNSIEWIRKYFPEYLIDGDRIKMYRGIGPFKSEIKSGFEETQPWRFAPNVPDGKTPNIHGYIVSVERIAAPPYVKYTETKISEEEFQKYCDSMNFFRNGGKQPFADAPGLDPTELHKGARGLREPFICKHGKFWTKPVTFFKWSNGGVWKKAE